MHEDCVLDWITRKIETADRVEIPLCEICHTQFSARMKVGNKKICMKLLLEKIKKLPKAHLALFVIHTIVTILVLMSLATFIWGLASGKHKSIVSSEAMREIFTHLVCQPYVILFYAGLVREKRWIVNESMVQIVEVTLKPLVVMKK